MDLAALPLFIVGSLVCIVMPGPGVLYVVANGLGRGTQASVAAAFGTTSAISIHIFAAVVGLAAILHASALIFNAVKIVGALYLLFLAWRTLRDRSAFLPEGQSLSPRSWNKVLLTGFALNILNPKLSVFFLAFLPQFVSPQTTSPTLAMLAMGAFFMAMTLAIFLLYGLFASQLRGFVLARPRITTALRWLFASLFGALGVRLALSERG